ncbi:MAG: hypothetical protein ACLFVT_04010 [Syntrophobacteria bacterium]
MRIHDHRLVAATSRGVVEFASGAGGTLRVRISPLENLPPYRSEAVVDRSWSDELSLLENKTIAAPGGLSVHMPPARECWNTDRTCVRSFSPEPRSAAPSG